MDVSATAAREFDALLATLVQEANGSYWSYKLRSSASGQRVLDLPDAEKCALVLHMIARLDKDRRRDDTSDRILRFALIDLLRRKLLLPHDVLVELVNWSCGNRDMMWYGLSALVNQIKHYLGRKSMTPQLHTALTRLVERMKTGEGSHQIRQYLHALEKLVEAESSLPLTPGEAWADQTIADVRAMPAAVQHQWIDLLNHLQSANGSAPSGKWLKQAQQLLEPVGADIFRAHILRWLPLVEKPRTAEAVRTAYDWRANINEMMIETNVDVLRGVVWLCAAREDGEVARALTQVALTSYRKVPGVGPRCVRLGNACVWALGNMPGREGIYQLALLQLRVKFGSAQKAIEKALAIAAERENLPREEIEELATPVYGLTEVGVRCEHLGDFTAELRVTGTNSVEITWTKADGKTQRSVPKQVKSEFAEEWKELQQAAKEIQKMLPAQRDRIDNLYLARKQWTYPLWRERYLDHPLIGVVARRLIWRFTEGATITDAIWHAGNFVTATGDTIAEFSPTMQVELWHPIDVATERVVAWRTWLAQHQVQQPFKQAHREIYLLTDAERNTHTYSNRFAAHVLRQHQFNSLCAVRGWRNKLRLMVDDSYPPAMKELSAWGLRAEYWIEGAGDQYNVDTNESGVFLRVVTDQVRFYQADAPENHAYAGGGGYGGALYGQGRPHEALPLEQIPALVFSEIMRDVDLFVGVASVGNDPTWADGGPEGRYQDYWTSYSFGDLSESAKTRKAVLEYLVPRLKIAKQCELRERFLVVRGQRRTYKIHLGSGNILMEPNDQYLCIVPNSRSADNEATPMFLPFEGDRTLAVILSKAFLLADDAKITDPTIVRQL